MKAKQKDTTALGEMMNGKKHQSKSRQRETFDTK
jgi:hypothetical protein